MSGFEDLGLHDGVLTALRAQGFDAPLPIQSAVLPPALEGRDVVFSAETGSGKTLAYLAPVFSRLLALGIEPGPLAVVLVPTRELAVQVGRVAEGLADHTGLEVALIHGGVPFRGQRASMERGAAVVVATPGRMRDLMGRGWADLSRVRTAVLDEADRMLSMGFVEDVRRILSAMPRTRQTLLGSATLDSRVREFQDEVLRDPARVEVGQDESRLPPGIRHEIAVVRQPLKRLLLAHLLADSAWKSVLVFAGTRFRAGALAADLAARGISAAPMHADLTQAQRDATLAAFREGAVRVLVATDLAERGLDIDRITHVVNFDPPPTPAVYLHRVGRTARLFGEGLAVSLAAPSEEEDLRRLVRAVGVRPSARTDPGFDHDQRPEGPDPLVDPAATARRPRRENKRAPQEKPSALRGSRGDQPAEKASFWERARARRKHRDR